MDDEAIDPALKDVEAGYQRIRPMDQEAAGVLAVGRCQDRMVGGMLGTGEDSDHAIRSIVAFDFYHVPS